MDISILIPHFKMGKITTYSIAQFLKYKGNHNIHIYISDNNAGDGSIDHLKAVEGITIIDYPKDKLQSHGIAIDMLIPLIKTEYFITAESDSFPTQDNWLDYYENLINEGYEFAASKSQLSGGEYGHPAGALYKKSNWQEAKKYCDSTMYFYFPNMAMKDNFPCHLMVHSDILVKFYLNPEDYIELSDSYKPYSIERAAEQYAHYSPVVAPFHNGQGRTQEALRTYGVRNIESETKDVLLDNRAKLIYRMGFEPGQWLCYWHHATNKKIFYIPTEVKWIAGKEYQQQEYTINEVGFKHIWAGSSFLDMKGTAQNDVYEFKKNQIEELYNSLPENQKIKE